MPLSSELYAECFDVLPQCSEFKDYEILQAVFVTTELELYKSDLPRASTPRDLVSQTIEHLLKPRLSGQRSAFPVFLKVLRDRRSAGDALRDMLDDLCIQAEQELNGIKAVDIPFVVVAMTRNQADALVAGTAPHHPRYEQFRAALQEHGINISNLVGGYGEARDDWKPDICGKSTISEIVSEMLDRINEQRLKRGKPSIKPEFLSSSFFDKDKGRETWRKLRQRGGVIIVDAVSMFHSELCEVLLNSGIDFSDRVAVVVFSPVNPCAVRVNQLIERELSLRMGESLTRFNRELDKLCEFNVGYLLALQRWLFSTLPEIADPERRLKMKSDNRAMLDRRLGPQQGMQGLVFGQ